MFCGIMRWVIDFAAVSVIRWGPMVLGRIMEWVTNPPCYSACPICAWRYAVQTKITYVVECREPPGHDWVRLASDVEETQLKVTKFTRKKDYYYRYGPHSKVHICLDLPCFYSWNGFFTICVVFQDTSCQWIWYQWTIHASHASQKRWWASHPPQPKTSWQNPQCAFVPLPPEHSAASTLWSHSRKNHDLVKVHCETVVCFRLGHRNRHRQAKEEREERRRQHSNPSCARSHACVTCCFVSSSNVRRFCGKVKTLFWWKWVVWSAGNCDTFNKKAFLNCLLYFEQESFQNSLVR